MYEKFLLRVSGELGETFVLSRHKIFLLEMSRGKHSLKPCYAYMSLHTSPGLGFSVKAQIPIQTYLKAPTMDKRGEFSHF